MKSRTVIKTVLHCGGERSKAARCCWQKCQGTGAPPGATLKVWKLRRCLLSGLCKHQLVASRFYEDIFPVHLSLQTEVLHWRWQQKVVPNEVTVLSLVLEMVILKAIFRKKNIFRQSVAMVLTYLFFLNGNFSGFRPSLQKSIIRAFKITYEQCHAEEEGLHRC